LALAAIAVVAPAGAADLPMGPSYYPPVTLPPAHYDWTGIYFGGHVGAGLLSDTVTQAAGPATATVTGTTDIGPVGIVGGAQAGVNFEFAQHWVIGAEATWSATNISGTANATTTAGAGESATSAPLWFATATGRLGYAGNDLMLYAKGGAALMKAGYTQNTTPLGPQSLGDNRTGFTAGVGLEYGLTENLSAKFEYDFLDFGTKTYNFTATPVSIRSDLSLLALGLNYRFTWGGNGRTVLCPTC
jgi:outer membrane immunogenic protein